MTPQTAAIEKAVATVGHALEEALDYLYWLRTDSVEDQAAIRSLRDDVRNSLYGLSRALREGDPS